MPAINRIEKCLLDLVAEGRKALIPFIVAGDPDLAASREIALAILASGADILEIGVPFSDPSADGPTIMAADTRALLQGTTINGVFDLVRDLRRETESPILLLLYYNTVLQMGLERFFETCREAGVDGIIVPDLPLEEQDEPAQAAAAANVIITRMVSPLSDSRLPALVNGARGFLYCVAALGVTGERAQFQTDLAAFKNQLIQISPIPRALGFGISTAEQVRELAPDWDAIIVGSAIVRRIAEGAAAGLNRSALAEQLADYVHSLRQALDAGTPGLNIDRRP
jgi:tryptophan synthase alpha chain